MADLDEAKLAHLTKILSQSPCLQIAHELKEEFRAIYEKDQTVKSGQIQIKKWLQIARIFFSDAAQTIQNHMSRICNYFISRATSGVMEKINTRIKLIMRQGYGFLILKTFAHACLLAFYISKSYHKKYKRASKADS